MSYYEEMSFCPVQEYEAWEPTRLQPGDIIVDERYMLMIYLTKHIYNNHTLKAPVRVHAVDNDDTVDVVRFNLEVPSHSETHYKAQVRNGYLTRVELIEGGGPMIFGIPGRADDAGVKRSYLRGHYSNEGGIDDQLRQMLEVDQELLVPA